MTDRELLQQALDALSWIANVNAMDYEYQRKARDSIKALEAELAKPEQEPKLSDAGVDTNIPLWGLEPKGSGMVALHQSEQEPVGRFIYVVDSDTWVQDYSNMIGQPLYTAPPRKPWVGLTDEEIDTHAQQNSFTPHKAPSWFVEVCRDIEAKLRERNT